MQPGMAMPMAHARCVAWPGHVRGLGSEPRRYGVGSIVGNGAGWQWALRITPPIVACMALLVVPFTRVQPCLCAQPRHARQAAAIRMARPTTERLV